MSGTQHLSEFYSLVDKESPLSSSTAVGSTPPIPSTSSSARYSRAAGGAYYSRNSSISSPVISPVDTSDHQYFHNPPSSSRFNMFRKPSVSSLGTVTSTIASTSYAAGVANNHPDLPALITSREVTETIKSYTEVVSAAQRYREALLTVSSAAAEFGAALEDCARCKGAGSSAESLHAAGGLHYLVSNHQQILAKSIQRTFEVPVRRQVDLFKSTMASNDESFKKELKVKTKQLKQHELENIRLSRMRVRNLAAYRNSLLELTSQIDDIDRLKYEHFCQAYDAAQTTSTNILTYAASVVRAEVEIYEGIARKGWSGGGLDDLISACPDPFAPSEEEEDEFDNGGTISKSKSNGNKFVETIQGLLNPSSSSATTASSSATIKSLKPQPSLSLASASLPPPLSNTVQKQHVKKSTGKGLFSILPSKSILPSFDSYKSEANDSVSYDSEDDTDEDKQLHDKNSILKSEEVSKPSETTANESSGTNILADSFFTNQATPSQEVSPYGKGHPPLSSLSSSLSSGFANQVSASTPIKGDSSRMNLNISPSRSATTSTQATAITSHKYSDSTSSNLSPQYLLSAHTTTATTSAPDISGAEIAQSGSPSKENQHLHGHVGSVTDSEDMMGYSGWGNVHSGIS